MPEMRRGKSQVLFRYTPHAMFRYNETYGWCAVTSIEMTKTSEMAPALAEALSDVLNTWKAATPGNFPNPITERHRYEVGEPYQVHYTLAPLVFVCRNCRGTQWYSTVEKAASNFRLACRFCEETGTLAQVPYMYIHECGREESLYVPKHEQGHKIVMVNRGRFQESYWYCETCHRSLTTPGKTGLGRRSCVCAKKKLKRGTTLQDPSVHYTRTISLVNTEDATLERALENASMGEVLLAGLLRTSQYRPADFESVLTPAPPDAEFEEKRAKARQGYIDAGVADEGMLEKLLAVFDAQVRSPQAEQQQLLRTDVQALVGPDSALIIAAAKSRPLLEYLFVRDSPRMQSQTLGSLLQTAEERGDALAMARYTDDQAAASRLGVTDLAVVQELPLLLAAVGFSRVFASPEQGTTAMLRPFITNRPKIPIYAVHNTTEAFLFELDPWWEAAWLLENSFVSAPKVPWSDETAVRAWLLAQRSIFLEERASHLELLPWERDNGAQVILPAAAQFGLLHTLSHMLVVAAATNVGFEADSLSEYLFPVAGAGVIYASGHQEYTLGGIVSAFRLNLTYWLQAAYEASQRCLYDPLCIDDGGACHMCSYLRFSCPHFNRTVSRSFLVGGPVAGLDKPIIGYWSARVHDRALQLRKAH